MKIVLLLCFVAAAFASTPFHPRWPVDFATSAVIRITGEARPYFNRWFYSGSQDVDRLDGLAEFEGEYYFAERYFEHKVGREYAVFYQRDASVQCYDRPITNPLPKPNFKNFTYVGEAIIDYVPVYHWIYRGPDNSFFQYFDEKESRQPKRFDAEFPNRPALQIQYFEFDEAPQSSDIFQIPSAIKAVCNPVNAKGKLLN